MKRFFGVLAFICPLLSMCQPLTLRGKVLSETGDPVAGATIILKRTGKATVADDRGLFTLTNTWVRDTILVTATGFQPAEEVNNERGLVTVTLRPKTGLLDEAVIIAYGTTTRRLSTGSVGRVSAAEIARQPVSNPLSALEGRVPGLLITPTSGVAGGAVKVEIRGRSSIAQSSDPLFIIDGVPFAAGNDRLNVLTSASTTPGDITSGGLSPFNSLNPADIESIEVLKDADATAIYGSRGANGVVLITTKKGKAGKTLFSLNLSSGFGKARGVPPVLSTPAYLAMRREAFRNDGVSPTAINAPDLLVYDTTRSTDFRRLLTGGTAGLTNLQATLSGGTLATQFLLNGGYYREGTVFPGKGADSRTSFRSQLSHTTPGGRLALNLSTYYAAETNNLAAADLTQYQFYLPPDMPALRDAGGHPVWQYNGVSFSDNPFAYLSSTSETRTENLQLSGVLSYKPGGGLTLRVSGGFNRVGLHEAATQPLEALNPLNSPQAGSQIATTSVRSFTLEPQLEYTHFLWGGRLTALAGGSLQASVSEGERIEGTGFSNSALLGFTGAAATIKATNSFSAYHYAALFSRVGYNWGDRYLLNFSGRRDGSSRFGPGRQWANFGAVGAGWVFTRERFFQKKAPFLSFGKLRGSYGSSGNDKIGDYQYLDSWVVTAFPYGTSTGLRPSQLYNPDYSWEENRKLEGGLEIGLWKDVLLVTVDAYQNRSGNQLLRYALPLQTGFAAITRNFPALVQNRGWEITLTKAARPHASWSWSSTFTLTLPRNTLLAFPDLATSSYNNLAIGAPLSVLRGYHFTVVDPATGIYTFEDLDKNGVLNSRDMAPMGSLDPRFYGGWSHTVAFKGWQLDLFLDFRGAKGKSYAAYLDATVPGSAYNQPTDVLLRWQEAGHAVPVEKFTTLTSSAVYKAYSQFIASDGLLRDASFVRLKNLSLAWSLPAAWLRRLHGQSGRFYFQGQNLLTVSRFPVADPEGQNPKVLPPLRLLTAGIQLTF